jgi:DNA-binding response OmpR family regulator
MKKLEHLYAVAMTADRHVLIVDDDAEVRAVLVAALRQRGLIPDEAEDGERAVDLLQSNHYSVVLLDLLMPGTDGFRVLHQLRVTEKLSPVVLVVSGADRSVISQVDTNAIHGLIRKPFDPQDVAAIVAACVEIRGRGAFETMTIAALLSTTAIVQQLL